MTNELKIVMREVAETEKDFPKYLLPGCELLRYPQGEGWHYAALVPDGYPVHWEGNNWYLPSPLDCFHILTGLQK